MSSSLPPDAVKFNVLVTNPPPDRAMLDPTTLAVFDYLEQVRSANICPFAQTVHDRNAYVLGVTMEPPQNIVLYQYAELIAREFPKRSRSSTEGHVGDPTMVAIAFGHPETREEDFGRRLHKSCRDLSLSFMQEQRMIADMYPQHDDPRGNGAFRSAVPIMVVRWMQRADHFFMKTHLERHVYESFFGAPPSHGGGES